MKENEKKKTLKTIFSSSLSLWFQTLVFCFTSCCSQFFPSTSPGYSLLSVLSSKKYLLKLWTTFIKCKSSHSSFILKTLDWFFFSFQTKSTCLSFVSGLPSWLDSSPFLSLPSFLLTILWPLFTASFRKRSRKVACHWLCPDSIETVSMWPPPSFLTWN